MKRTKKLVRAADILSGERFLDCAPEAFIAVAQLRRVTPDQIYQVMERFGYRWNSGRESWLRPLPTWMENLRKDKRLYSGEYYF